IALAYIVTYGTPAAEAAKDPHAIVYEDFVTVEGVTIASRWTFRSWSAAEGIHGETLGTARLGNVRFVEANDASFARPKDAREDKLPGS
ncbi:MAG: hypothetical protein ACYTGC_01600, partial [Planctomycetota bacterium]